MKKNIIFVGLLFASFCVQAQEKWSLRQCVDHAIQNNIELRQQSLKVSNAEINLSTSKNSRLPNLNARVTENLGFGRSPSIATGVYEENKALNTNFGISSSLPLFTGFRIPNEIKRDELDLKSATEGLKKAKDNLELQVVSLFLEVLFKKEILKTYQDQYDLTFKQVEKTTILTESGKAPASQLFDIKAQLAKDETNVTVASNELSLSLLTLSQSLNMTSSDNFDIVAPDLDNMVDDNLSSVLPPNQVYQMALGIKPQIREAEYNLESSRRTLKIAQSGYWPTLDLNLSYESGFGHVYKQGYNNPAISKQIRNNNRESIGLTLSIPIFNRFQVRNKVRAARLDIENQGLMLDNVKLILYKEIQQAYQSALSAQAKYTSTGRACEAAEESFKYARERYDIGKSTVFEYSEAQTKLLTSKSEQIQAKYDFVFRAKILDFYQGKQIDIK